MVLTAYFVLSPVIGLFCHRRFRIWFCLRPVGPASLRELDAGVEASGPHDFAVRFSISRQLAVYRSRGNPALPSRRALRRCRVHRIPCPTSVTIAKRPSVGRDGRGYRSDLAQTGTEIFLQIGLDRKTTEQPVGQISQPVRRSSKSEGGKRKRTFQNP